MKTHSWGLAAAMCLLAQEEYIRNALPYTGLAVSVAYSWTPSSRYMPQRSKSKVDKAQAGAFLHRDTALSLCLAQATATR